MQQLNRLIEQEWINQGNSAKYFQEFGPKIILILDNASFHKRKDILAKIAQELPNFVLEFLPPYSPDYNIIELVWYSSKEYIAPRLFQSLDELKSILDKKDESKSASSSGWYSPAYIRKNRTGDHDEIKSQNPSGAG